MGKTYPLKVQEIKKETKDSVVLSFDVPQNLIDVFKYKPGQYLTLQFNLNGQQVRRSYSLCSAPSVDKGLTIAVKRVKDGVVSNHINDTIKAGDVVDVLPPEGRFYAEIKKDNYKTYYLFCAGSGITPILSILKSVLHTEQRSFVYMIFGNRNQESIMFQKELKELQSSFKNRFSLIHSLSRPISSWSDLWKKESDYDYKKGRINSNMIQWLVNEFPPYAQNAEYYICGPGTMITNTKNALKNIDVPESRIFTESFGGSINDSKVKGVLNAKLITRLNNNSINLSIPQGKTLLRTLIDDGHNPPYSCEGGVCSTCICKLKQGKVHMKNNLSLSETEIEQGFILSCQSIPLTETIEIEYPKK